MSEAPKTIEAIVAQMRKAADIVERNIAQQPGAKTVAQTRRVEREGRACELRMFADKINEAARRAYNEIDSTVGGIEDAGSSDITRVRKAMERTLGDYYE